jgi:long-chain acyl-CoA synthetase
VKKIWLDSCPKGASHRIDVDALGSIADLSNEAVLGHSNWPAFVSGSTGVSISYAELDRMSKQVAAYFQPVLRLPLCTRVAIMMPNLLQHPVCLFGLLRAGYVVVNVNPMYTPRELAHQLQDSGAKAMIVVEMFAHTLEKAMEGSPLEQVVVPGLSDTMLWPKRVLVNALVRHVKRLVPPYPLHNSVRYSGMLAQDSHASFAKVAIAPQDLAFLQCTGGTTGVSKGAMLSHRNAMAKVKQTQVWSKPFLEPEADLISITAIPPHHILVLGSCLTLLGMSGTNVLVADPWNIPAFVRILRQHRFVSPSAFSTWLNERIKNPDFPKDDFSRRRLAIGGGASVQRPLAERWQETTGCPLGVGHGLTECSPAVRVNPFDLKTFNGSIGLPSRSKEVSIRTRAAGECAVGEAGEWCVRGPQLMLGCCRRPRNRAVVTTTERFLRTGGVAVIGETGFSKTVKRPTRHDSVVGLQPVSDRNRRDRDDLPRCARSGCGRAPQQQNGQAGGALCRQKNSVPQRRAAFVALLPASDHSQSAASGVLHQRTAQKQYGQNLVPRTSRKSDDLKVT